MSQEGDRNLREGETWGEMEPQYRSGVGMACIDVTPTGDLFLAIGALYGSTKDFYFSNSD